MPKLIVDGEALKKSIEADHQFIETKYRLGKCTKIITGELVTRHILQLDSAKLANARWVDWSCLRVISLAFLPHELDNASIATVPLLVTKEGTVMVPKRIDVTKTLINNNINVLKVALELFELGFPITPKGLSVLKRLDVPSLPDTLLARYASILLDAQNRGLLKNPKTKDLIGKLMAQVEPKKLLETRLNRVGGYNFGYDLSDFPNSLIRIEE